MGWGEKAELKEEILESMASDRADIKRGKRELADAKLDFEFEKKRTNLQTDVDNQKKQAELEERERSIQSAEKLRAEQFELTKVEFLNEKADFEIEKKKVEFMRQDLDRQIANAKAEVETAVRKAVAEKESEMVESQSELRKRVEEAEAKSTAKDEVIEASKAEIARLDELLKVTMGKLTQIDIKGLNIHVEAANAPKGNKPEGKPEGK